MADLIITDTQQVSVGPVTVYDKKGAEAQLDGAPTCASNNEAALTITDNGDGTWWAVAAMPGSAQITISGDADLGEGVETLTKSFDIQVVAGKATGLNVAIGAPVEQEG